MNPIISYFLGLASGVLIMVIVRTVLFNMGKMAVKKGERLLSDGEKLASEIESVKNKIDELWQQVDRIA